MVFQQSKTDRNVGFGLATKSEGPTVPADEVKAKPEVSPFRGLLRMLGVPSLRLRICLEPCYGFCSGNGCCVLVAAMTVFHSAGDDKTVIKQTTHLPEQSSVCKVADAPAWADKDAWSRLAD